MSARQVRRGFTLVEMIISMTLTIAILGIVVPFFISNVRVMASHARRMDAFQNARFGVNTIDRELRVAGSGVVSSQPLLVQADSMAITFNADLVSRSETDAGAVYYDPDADEDGVSVMRPSGLVTLPRSARTYPDTAYTQAGGAPSTAETISYWVSADTAADAGGLNALYRRVNNLPATMVARGLVIVPGSPTFRYFKADTIGRLVEIPRTMLPIYHTAKVHGSLSDTLLSALTDSVRLIRVSFSARSTDRQGKVTTRVIETAVRIMNSGLLHHSTCGEPPIFSSVVNRSVDNTTPPAVVILTWSKAADESTGEKDVERYAVFRRRNSVPDFAEPIASVPAGNATYQFTDSDVVSGDQWVYGIAAEDCSGQMSSIRTTASVTIP